MNRGLHAVSSVDPRRNFSENQELKQESYFVLRSLQSSPMEFIFTWNFVNCD